MTSANTFTNLKKWALIVALWFLLQRSPLRAQGQVFGDCTASGSYSTAFGDHATAIGGDSVAIGYNTTTYGWYSQAFGLSTTALGSFSTASGMYSTASGNYSTASGYYTTAGALDSFAVGAYNGGGGDPLNWIGTDPLFEVGNGYKDWDTNIAYPSDAFVVYKNGNATVSGTLSVIGSSNAVLINPAGDLSMGQFQNGPHPH